MAVAVVCSDNHTKRLPVNSLFSGQNVFFVKPKADGKHVDDFDLMQMPATKKSTCT